MGMRQQEREHAFTRVQRRYTTRDGRRPSEYDPRPTRMHYLASVDTYIYGYETAREREDVYDQRRWRGHSGAPEKETRELRRVGKRRRERGRRQAQRSARRNTNQLRQGFATGMSYPHLASASRSGAEKQIWMGHSSLPSAMTTAGLDGQARLQQI